MDSLLSTSFSSCVYGESNVLLGFPPVSTNNGHKPSSLFYGEIFDSIVNRGEENNCLPTENTLMARMLQNVVNLQKILNLGDFLSYL